MALDGEPPGAETPAPTGAEAMVRLLAGHGVSHVFGLCGDTSLPLYDALARTGVDLGLRHILARDERHAAYMADAFARLTGRVGVCEGPSGGGATYIAPGLAEANESGVPVLAITTDVATGSAGRFPLTELDQQALFAPLTKWRAEIGQAALLPRLTRRAFREASTGRTGAVQLTLPFDVQKAAVDPEDLWVDARYGRFPAHRLGPDPDDVEAALGAILGASRALIVCGGGVTLSGAEDALDGFARALNIPVATTISGQGALPETHPLCLGVTGSNGGAPSVRAAVDAADCVIFIGCRAGSVTTERWRSPKPTASIVHIDVDPAVFGAAYETDAAVLGDARLALEALTMALIADGAVRDFDGAAAAERARAAKFAAYRPLAESASRPIKPERVVAAVRAALPDDAVLVADPGTPCPYFSAFYEIRGAGRRLITNRAHGALGFALGAAIGAQFARPNAKVLAAMGDGSFGFAVGELETLLRYELPITCLVFSNATFGWIRAGQKSGFGGRYMSTEFLETDHAAVAAAYGLKSWRVTEPAELEPAIRAAVASDGPSLVDVVVESLEDAAAPVSEWIA